MARRTPPARDPQARENEMIVLATDLAAQQLRDGTASAQVITHYLKSGSVREQMEREKLREEVRRLHAQTEQLEAAVRVEDLMGEVLTAMRSYQGVDNPDEYLE